jgi:hypothetical protein
VVLDGTANWLVNANIVIPEGYSAASGVKITGRVANNPITTSCGLWRVTVTGECVYAFDMTNIGAEATANNEAHMLVDCRASGYTGACIHCRGSQVHKIHLDHCVGDGSGNGSLFIDCEYGAYVRGDNCRSTGHAAFCYLGSTLIVNALQGCWSIEDARFLVVGGGSSGTSTGVYVTDNYVDHGTALNVDQRSILQNTNAPVVLRSNYIRAENANIEINQAGITNNRITVMSGNVIEGPNPYTFVSMFPNGAPRGCVVDGGGGNMINGERVFLQDSHTYSGFGFDGAAPAQNAYGLVELAAGATYADVVFDVQEEDADYLVVGLAIEQLTGTAGSLRCSADSKTDAGFRINLSSAVPVGCTIAVGWIIARADT